VLIGQATYIFAISTLNNTHAMKTINAEKNFSNFNSFEKMTNNELKTITGGEVIAYEYVIDKDGNVEVRIVVFK
jgi:bacteriocin-like protein